MTKSAKIKNTPNKNNIKMRENPKALGTFQYKKKFRFKDSNGIVHQTETRWCPSPEIAIQEARNIQNNQGLKQQVKGTIGEYFLKYIDELKEMTSKSKKTTHKLSTTINEKESACGLFNVQTPDIIKNCFVSNFDSKKISQWLDYVDNGTSLEMELSYSSVRRKILIISKFVGFLSRYAPANQIEDLKLGIKNYNSRTPKNFGARNDRVEIKNEHLIAIFNHYLSGEYSFSNYYWYTLFLTLFCTGMRVGELVALQWKDIQLDEDPAFSVIYINKSIHEKEFPEHAIATINAGNGAPKNENSKREISIFTANRNALIIYKKLCFYHYYVECGYKKPSDMDNDFVFRNYRSKEHSQYYQTHKNILKELKNTSKKIEIPASDAQMFRHATARFLILDCGLYKEDVFEFFGHSSIKMIDSVYGKLGKKEQRIRSTRSLVDLIGSETANRIRRGVDQTMFNYLNHDISKNRDDRFYMIHNMFIFFEIVSNSYKAYKSNKNMLILTCDKEIYSRMCRIRELCFKDFQEMIERIKAENREDTDVVIDALMNECFRSNQLVFEWERIGTQCDGEWPIYYHDFDGLNEPIDIKNLEAIEFVMKNKLLND